MSLMENLQLSSNTHLTCICSFVLHILYDNHCQKWILVEVGSEYRHLSNSGFKKGSL